MFDFRGWSLRPATQSRHNASDADAALDFLKTEEGSSTTSNEIDQSRLVRKIDWMIVPLMWMVYNLQYLDKTLINYAAVMGLYADTGITTNQFSLLALVFYVTYLAFELPTGFLMQRFPTAKYLGLNVVCWGVCVAATSACKTFGSLVAVRVLLGIFESAVAPALILLTAMWYTKKEQPLRIGFWYTGMGTGTIIGALASFGFQHYTGKVFTAWQIMFLVFGVITIAVGLWVMAFLPDNPMSARLSNPEKLSAIERVRSNQTGIENKKLKPSQVREGLLDPHTWLIALATISSNVCGGAVGSFQATIIQGFGFTSQQTALLSIPSGAISIISVLAATFFASYFDQRALLICVFLLLTLLGGALMAFLPDGYQAGKLAGNYLTNCIGGNLPLLYAWVAANTAGHSKKVTLNAVVLMSFCLGNILGPLTFQTRDAPQFIPAKVAIVATTAFAVLMVLILRTLLVWENRRRDRGVGVGLVYGGTKGSDSGLDRGFLDLTDRENGAFRYRL